MFKGIFQKIGGSGNFSSVSMSGGGECWVNGVRYVGNSVEVQNGEVFIDGKKQGTAKSDGPNDSREIRIEIKGNVGSVEVGSGTVSVVGEVGSIESSTRDIQVQGNVSGDIELSTGNIHCNDVRGDIDISCGSVIKQR